MYEDPNVTERSVTVVFTFASDDENDAAMRAELVAGAEQLADRLGYDAEIHHERMISEADDPHLVGALLAQDRENVTTAARDTLRNLGKPPQPSGYYNPTTGEWEEA